MRKFVAALAAVTIGFIAMAPAANALIIDVNTGGLLPPVEVKVLEPDATPALVDADATNDAITVEALTGGGLADGVTVDSDLAVLPILNDPLVHVCVNGLVQTVLTSVAVNLHLDVLGADETCAPTAVIPTTPPSNDDPLVHVCVNGAVQSVLASVAANLHLDVLGSDDACKTTTVTNPPTGTDDPLVHVCVDGKVTTFLASVALNLHLDVLGSDEACPPGTPVTPVTPTNPPVIGGDPVPGPGVTVTVPGATDTPAPFGDVAVKPAEKKHTGPLAFTGNNWVRILAGLGIILLVGGVLLRRFGRI